MNRVFSCLLFFSFFAQAQLPDTDIWLFKLGIDKSNTTAVLSGKNVTNRPGYDNQPSFSEDGKTVYYVSIREDKQADIYAFKPKNPQPVRLTFSEISEYSPKPLPGTTELYAVVVEKDSAQRIHFINPVSSSHSGILPFDSVGYCCFVNADTIVYYKLTEPHSLRFHVRSTGEDKFICASPTRTIKTINRHSFLFGIKDSLSASHYQYDFLLRKAVKIATSEGPAEDAYWHSQWGLMRSEGNKILKFNANNSFWESVLDLSTYGVQKIGRFIFSADNKYLVLVEVRDSK